MSKKKDRIAWANFLEEKEMPKANPKRSKHGSNKVEIDGIIFDSKKEGNRYRTLKILEKVGDIQELKLQVPFPLVIKKLIVNDIIVELPYQFMRNYVADFTYMENGQYTVEDVKSEHTRTLKTYKLKKRLMKAIYQIDIKET